MQWKVEISLFLIVIFFPTCHRHVAGTHRQVSRVLATEAQFRDLCSLLAARWFVHEKECIEIWFLAPYLPIYPTGIAKEDWTSLHVNPVLDHERYLIEHIPCTRQYDRAIHDCARPTDALCLNS